MVTLHFTPVILAHVATALGAVLAGGAMLAMRKGTRMHRLLGRAWVLLMAFTALVSFGIQSRGHFSWIHLLSVATLVILFLAVRAAMRGNIVRHRRGMAGVYIGLITAGAFAMMPGRRFGELAWQAVGLI